MRWTVRALTPRQTSLEVGIHGAEPWTNEIRTAIEEPAAEMHAVDIYGLSEIIGPGVVLRVRRDQGRSAFMGRPLLSRRSSIRTPGKSGRRRRSSANWCSRLAQQGSHAGGPLPHPRPDPPVTRNRSHHAPHGKGHGPVRRHADHPRRQSVPEPDRGTGGQDSGAFSPHYQLELYKQGNLDGREAPMSKRSRALPMRPGPPEMHLKKSDQATDRRLGIDIEVHEPGGVARSEGKAQRIVDKR